eukprot:g14045.t1
MKANPRKAWAILRRFLGKDSPRQIENNVGEVVVGKDAATVFAEQYHKQLNRPSNLPAPPIHEIASVTEAWPLFIDYASEACPFASSSLSAERASSMHNNKDRWQLCNTLYAKAPSLSR